MMKCDLIIKEINIIKENNENHHWIARFSHRTCYKDQNIEILSIKNGNILATGRIAL